MAQAAYAAKLKKGGTPTAFDYHDIAPIGNSPREYSFFIANYADNFVLDASKPITIHDDDTGNEYVGKYSVDYIAGIIMFEDDVADTRTLQMSGTFIPVITIGGIHAYSLDLTGDIVDTTTFQSAQANGGFKSMTQAMNDVSISFDRYADFTGLFQQMLLNRERILIEILLGNGADKIRGWFVAETTNASGEQTGVEEETISLQLDGEINDAFSWRTK